MCVGGVEWGGVRVKWGGWSLRPRGMEVVEATAIGEAELCAWAAGALVAAGTREADAAQIARCLVDVDLRGVKSHGTRQLPGYIQLLLANGINPVPEIRTLRESDSSIRLDGGASL